MEKEEEKGDSGGGSGPEDDSAEPDDNGSDEEGEEELVEGLSSESSDESDRGGCRGYDCSQRQLLIVTLIKQVHSAVFRYPIIVKVGAHECEGRLRRCHRPYWRCSSYIKICNVAYDTCITNYITSYEIVVMLLVVHVI